MRSIVHCWTGRPVRTALRPACSSRRARAPGKTFTIGLIFPCVCCRSISAARRADPRRDVQPDRAAQELRDRLRPRLVDAEHRSVQSLDEPDILSEWLLTLCPDDATRSQALRRVQLARADLDRAPIQTIHSLCQRILRDHAIESRQRVIARPTRRRRKFAAQMCRGFLASPLSQRRDGFSRRRDRCRKRHRHADSGFAQVLRVDASFVPLGDAAMLERDVMALRTTEHLDAIDALVANASLFARSNAKLRSRLSNCAESLRSTGDVVRTASRQEPRLRRPGSARETVVGQRTRRFVGARGHRLAATHSLCPQRSREYGRRARSCCATHSPFVFSEIPRRAREARRTDVFDVDRRRPCAPVFGSRFGRFHDSLFRAFSGSAHRRVPGRRHAAVRHLQPAFSAAAMVRSRGLLAMIGDPEQANLRFPRRRSRCLPAVR